MTASEQLHRCGRVRGDRLDLCQKCDDEKKLHGHHGSDSACSRIHLAPPPRFVALSTTGGPIRCSRIADVRRKRLLARNRYGGWDREIRRECQPDPSRPPSHGALCLVLGGFVSALANPTMEDLPKIEELDFWIYHSCSNCRNRRWCEQTWCGPKCSRSLRPKARSPV